MLSILYSRKIPRKNVSIDIYTKLKLIIAKELTEIISKESVNIERVSEDQFSYERERERERERDENHENESVI